MENVLYWFSVLGNLHTFCIIMMFPSATALTNEEEKELLFKDLSQRLHYKVKCNVYGRIGVLTGLNDYVAVINFSYGEYNTCEIQYCKPYLFPMSSMTNEEIKEYELLCNHCIVTSIGFIHLEAAPLIDWLNKHHFYYRGLIEKGLAIEVTKDFHNPYERIA